MRPAIGGFGAAAQVTRCRIERRRVMRVWERCEELDMRRTRRAWRRLHVVNFYRSLTLKKESVT